MTRFILLLFILLPALGFTQIQISGVVVDSVSNDLVPFVTVTFESRNGNILGFTTSDDNGAYILKTDSLGEYELHFNSLIYKHKILIIDLQRGEQQIIINAKLSEQINELNEVLIIGEVAIAQKKDTIIFDASLFSSGDENVVEDLLKKIPGVSVDDEGIVRVEGVEIEKLMVDGDDFFEKGYRILSKNLPVHPIDKIEVLKNYSNNHLLKGIEKSNKVALNLTLDEKAKRVWFGNVDTGLGNEKFYKLIGNLANFGTSNKYYFLTNVNNIGMNATGDVDYLIRPPRDGSSKDIGDNRSVRNTILISPRGLNLKRSRINFNNSRLLSLNAIFNPSEKIKIKTIGFFNWDKQLFYKNTFEQVKINNFEFNNTENFEISNQKKIAFGKFDMVYNFSKRQMLQYSAKLNSGSFQDGSALIFNESNISEDLAHTNRLFDQKVNFTHQLNNQSVFLFTARLINEKAPQNYKINKFLFSELFPLNETADNVTQTSNNSMLYGGLEARLMRRLENNDLLEIRVGNEYRNDELKTSFSLISEDTIFSNFDDFENQIEYKVNDFFAKGEYKYSIQDLTIIGKVDLHKLVNKFTNSSSTDNEDPFFVNPSLGLDWTINDSNRLISNISFNTTNASVLNVFDDYILTGFRAFSKGTGTFNQLSASSFFLKYELGNWKKRFFANTSLNYRKDHDFFSTNSVVRQNFTLSDKIVIDGRETFIISSEAEYFFKSIKSTLKLKGNYSISEFKNIVNESDFRNIKSSQLQFGMDMRSGFRSGINFHFGTKLIRSEIASSSKNTFLNNISFLDFYFVFSDKIDGQVNSERYDFRNIEDGSVYCFLDINVRYKINNNKIVLSLAGKNLFNTTTFRNISVTDISTSVTEIRLLPFHFLLSMEYKF